MSSLRAWLVGKGGTSHDAAGEPVMSDGIVLPRLLRRPARMLARIIAGDVEPPRYAASMLTAGFLSLSAAYGAWLGGEIPTVVQAVTSRLGFALEEVKVSGHHETSEIDILERLGLDGWTSTIGFDAEAARERIASLPWVETVAVRKIYPDALDIRISERPAFAIWQHGSELSLIERDGHLIAPYGRGHHVALPLIIGQGAPQAAPGFIDKLRAFPELASRVKGYIRVAERRWDIRFENGVTVKLPQAGEDQALAFLARLDRESGLLSRDILAVDMRFPDRLVVQLTPEAAMQRAATVKDMLKPRPKGKSEKKA